MPRSPGRPARSLARPRPRRAANRRPASRRRLAGSTTARLGRSPLRSAPAAPPSRGWRRRGSARPGSPRPAACGRAGKRAALSAGGASGFEHSREHERRPGGAVQPLRLWKCQQPFPRGPRARQIPGVETGRALQVILPLGGQDGGQFRGQLPGWARRAGPPGCQKPPAGPLPPVRRRGQGPPGRCRRRFSWPACRPRRGSSRRRGAARRVGVSPARAPSGLRRVPPSRRRSGRAGFPPGRLGRRRAGRRRGSVRRAGVGSRRAAAGRAWARRPPDRLARRPPARNPPPASAAPPAVRRGFAQAETVRTPAAPSPTRQRPAPRPDRRNGSAPASVRPPPLSTALPPSVARFSSASPSRGSSA